MITTEDEYLKAFHDMMTYGVGGVRLSEGESRHVPYEDIMEKLTKEEQHAKIKI